ncbi:3-oxo-tetronate 4-phosphate decarboxylase [Ruegeria jejuensis]|uniref:3-oxo-tetronate 4-phosphate decarboxylase n=1 Tax=Ruegeria jejuensis TaxID=3233338 RepID=UPI00355B39D2
MSEEAKLREEICVLAKSLFDRGLTCGASGNISARLSDGTLLMTPTGSSMGFLDPSRISHLDANLQLLSGDRPTKEIPLHTAFYDTRNGTGAVVHLHSTHSVAVSMLPETDPDNALPPLTPYSVMRLGRIKLLPVFLPGDAAMGDAVRGLAGQRTAVLLANHGPVVAGRDLWAAVFAMEELEETAKLTLLTRGLKPSVLTIEEVRAVNKMGQRGTVNLNGSGRE